MTLEVTQLSELSQTDVDAARVKVKALLTEQQSNVNVLRGLISDLVVEPEAILRAAETEMATRIQQSGSILDITANSDIASDTLIDSVASNYRVTRQAATEATGEITIVLSDPISFTIPMGAVYTANGKEFVTEQVFIVRADSGLVDDSLIDRGYTELSDGTWAFTITVVSSGTGSAYKLSRDTELTPENAPTGHVITYVTEDFTGGLDTQTNDEIIAALAPGMSAKTFSSPVNLLGLLRSAPTSYAMVTEDFASISAVSVVGAGNAAMLRDRHWLFPLSVGGRVDVYLRSQITPATAVFAKTATLLSKDGDNGTWSAQILRGDAPGFYDIVNIRPTESATTVNYYASGTTTITLDSDLTGTDYVPDIVDNVEAVYSRYQTATVTFIDPATTATVGATASYDFTCRVMPLVENVQQFLGHSDILDPGGDVLVKAAVPCFVTLVVTLDYEDLTAVVDDDTVKDAVCAYVNGLGFFGKLYASRIASIIQPLLPAGVTVNTIQMTGVAYSSDGSTHTISSSMVLSIPDYPEKMLTVDTASFFLSPADISFSS